MIKNTSYRVLLLILAVSVFTFMRASAPLRLSQEKQASEQGITPVDEDIPSNSEDSDDSDSFGDNEADEALILEKDFLSEFLSAPKQLLPEPVNLFRERYLEITTPPPKV